VRVRVNLIPLATVRSLVPHDQFACSGEELQSDGKFFVSERLTINYSRSSPHATARGFDNDATLWRPRPSR
jgi:hypothetical protein